MILVLVIIAVWLMFGCLSIGITYSDGGRYRLAAVEIAYYAMLLVLGLLGFLAKIMAEACYVDGE